jgi:hypothetical protein
LVLLFVSSLLTINVTSIVIVPKIEKYSQASAIEFYKYLSKKNAYIETIGFKSYAHLYYSQKSKLENNEHYSMDWLLSGAIDKPCYFVAKLDTEQEIKEQHKDLKKIYTQGGFVFYVRNPVLLKYSE